MENMRAIIIGEYFQISHKAKTLEEAVSSASEQGELNGKIVVLGMAENREEALKTCRGNYWYSTYDKSITSGFSGSKWREVYLVKIFTVGEPDPEYDEDALARIDWDEGYDTMPFWANGAETETIESED